MYCTGNSIQNSIMTYMRKESKKRLNICICVDFPGGLVVKNPPANNAEDIGLIPGPGISPGEGNGKQLQYSYLGKPMDRRCWQITIHGVAKLENKQ